MSPSRDRWFDDAAGPLVRLYAVTRGRARSSVSFDLITVVAGVLPPREDRASLDPEHLRLLAWCRRPTAVADLASEMDLPLSVVRILLGDLHARNLITVRQPPLADRRPDEPILRRMLDELRAL
jgi:Protein of unknown function (DUF742)